MSANRTHVVGQRVNDLRQHHACVPCRGGEDCKEGHQVAGKDKQEVKGCLRFVLRLLYGMLLFPLRILLSMYSR